MAKKSFSDFAEFQRHMDALGLFHMRLGFERMREAARRLDMVRSPAPLAQVVGTNGKGSTAFFLSRLAMEHGFSVGLFTSPHFLTLRERIRLNGFPASEERILTWANTVHPVCHDLGLTYFETIALMAMVGFSAERVDLIVLEAGLGGRNDATSTWSPNLLLITPIGLDHDQIIGPGLENIARDKAGAIKPGTVVFSAPQAAVVRDVLEQEAAGQGVVVRTVNDITGMPSEMRAEIQAWGAIAPALPGDHQRDNARLALAGWTSLALRHGWPMRPDACEHALTSRAWPGRLQRVTGTPEIPSEIILDGAHNPPALETLNAALGKLAIRPGAVIFTCMRDKDLAGMAPLVRQLTSGPIFVPELPTQPRSRPAREIVRELGPQAQAAPDPATALALASSLAAQADGPILVCGSLYLLAEIYALHPKWLDA
ncbi:folylpolyglutamate synthase/dihydrofolate synthase family protein [Desulfonatronum sp. SC1]|uniref:bifunctional folylpolyglutamate synthase/dihydrofolate synthase n=1 Tax=Desulfonatronum sp. SC1 TaxID=2109626 RepID=UPI000D32413C|nr:bifunctional folylpolyglutamate synthase/dihydrofolate synthase [Desulfonatronum sp. SC1]PTN31607.1 bifunctional folylpolyglutamate synthase/dihydrofolate synthase [Desulfonatronum sp. SC1]